MEQEIPAAIPYGEAAKRWGASISTLRRRVKEGKIKTRKPGKHVLLVVSSGDAWCQSTGNNVEETKPGRRRRIW